MSLEHSREVADVSEVSERQYIRLSYENTIELKRPTRYKIVAVPADDKGIYDIRRG